MHFSGLSEAALAAAGAPWTAREIAQQPGLWCTVAQAPGAPDAALAAFLEPLLRDPALRIVLTGAGSSAFVGECLAPALTRRLQGRVAAVSTTDLVAGPANWLLPAVPTLLVSFARSGNSPESVAALQLAEQIVHDCHHLVITCNAQGALSEIAGRMDNAHVVLLPPQSNDQGFAMTSSFSSMLLAAALAFGLLRATAVPGVATAALAVLDRGLDLVQALVRAAHERVIYLGANEMKGLAREAALKLLELSDGQVVALADTPLGFRHGPKTVVNARALVVVFVSADPYSRRYDLDLLAELRRDGAAGCVLAVAGEDAGLPAHADNFVIPAAAASGDLAACFAYLVFAQFFALMRSLSLGVTPDNPNPAGLVSRVVKGVTIHPWQPAG